MIHKFSISGTNIVVDVNSGVIHVFDDVSYEILDYFNIGDKSLIVNKLSNKYGKEQVAEAFEEICRLENKGILFSDDSYIEEIADKRGEPVIKALCLHVAHDCNMRCEYCFAQTGDFGTKRSLMTAETGKKSIDFLIESSGNRINLEVDFFGGEPLLNFDVVKEIVRYAREREKELNKHFRFTITTNALSLQNKHKNFINENFDNIVMSIDGRKSVNDNMRHTVNGLGTYEIILPKIKDIAESRNQDRYYVRGTFTRENLDFSRDVLHLADEGFQQISIEPVVAAKDTGYDIREEDLPVLLEEYEKLAMLYVDRKKKGQAFNFFHFIIDLEHGPCIYKRITGCGAGYEYLAVTPEGDIYPCHQFVGIDEFKMGNVYSGIKKTSIKELFRSTTVFSREECKNCWAKYYCSGGCAANAYQFSNDIKSPYKIGCELEKKRLECAIWIKTQEHEQKSC